jgi:hypothetical protein
MVSASGFLASSEASPQSRSSRLVTNGDQLLRLVAASANVAASREIKIGRFSSTVNVKLNVSVNAKLDLGLINPSYVFATVNKVSWLHQRLHILTHDSHGHTNCCLNGTSDAAARQGTICFSKSQ